jgi:hypothetical protein
MATRVHRTLKAIAFNANGIGRQRYELSKHLQDLHLDVALFLDTHLKHHERFFIPNYHFYRTDRHLGRKGGTAVAVRKCIPLNHLEIPPFVSVEVTGVCIPVSNSEVLLAAVYKSPGKAWSDADIAELLSFRRKSILAGDLNAKHTFWNSRISNPSGEKLVELFDMNSKFLRHYAPLIIPMREMVTRWILWSTKISECQMSSDLIFWVQITYQQYSTYWMSKLGIFRNLLKNSQFGIGFKVSPLR